jgi:anti-anti-sigma factor
VIIDAVVFGMMDVAEMRRLWRITRADFWIALAAILGVLSAGVLAGVVIGILLSLCWLVWVSANPATPVLARQPGTTAFRSLSEYPDGETHPGVLVMRFDGGLDFVTTEVLVDRLRELVLDTEPPIRHVVLDFGGVNFVDSQGSAELGRLLEVAEQRGATVDLARVKPEVRAVLAADGVVDRLGERHLHPNLDLAVRSVVEGPSGR